MRPPLVGRKYTQRKGEDQADQAVNRRVSDWSRMRNVRLGLNIPPAGARPFDVAGFGLNSIDLLAVVAEYPASNSKQRLQRFMHLPGGQIGTALTACAKLGLTATYVGSFGSDPLGAMSRQSLLDAGVD